MELERLTVIYKSRNFITLLNWLGCNVYANIYKSRNFITLLNSNTIDWYETYLQK